VACAVLAATGARADLFSPGDLTKQHAPLEGISNCTKCHPAGNKLSQETCLNCHTELQPRLGAGQGLHGRISDDKRDCQKCHHEHQGRNAALVDWGTAAGKKGFDHKRTGWPLKGEHLKTDCAKCHEKRLITWPVAQKLLETRQTMLGLDRACEGCHFDEHRGQQKQDCEYCHNEKAWKPASGFDHNSPDYQYPLLGKHAKLKCDKCHPAQRDAEKHAFPVPKSETYLKFSGITNQPPDAPPAFGLCTDCHRDPHENRFGQRCTSCHTVESWQLIRNASKEREFHEKTRYPLKGLHLEVECRSCHGPFPGQAPRFKGLKFEACTDCHADAHVGQLATGKAPLPECTSCHSVDGFSPVKYGLSEHAKTRYPLEGAHMVVPCDACHEATPALQKKVAPAVLADLKRKRRKELFSPALLAFAKPLDRCDSCHLDAHKGQLQEKACSACHVTQSFEKLRFDHQKESRYPLVGKHLKVACDKCHFVPAGSKDVVGGKPVVKYRPLEQKCSSCHLDVHLGQFAKKGELADCERCHAVEDWKQLRFKHEPPFTTYLLEGQHAKVQCAACHQKVTLPGKVETVKYRPLPRACESCHADFHQGAFQGFEP
jgi:hypothetical protein